MHQYLDIFLVLLVTLLGTTTATLYSEGQSFSLSFSQSRSDWDEGDCILYINAKQDTTATIHEPSGTSETVAITANQTFSRYYSYTIRVVEGVEEKGFLVEATDNVTVMLSNYRNDANMDAMLVFPLHTGPQEYTILSFPSTNDITCVSGATCSFFSVVASQDTTAVDVYKLINGQPVLLGSYTLDENEVLTNRTVNVLDDRNYDFTGYFITADKPVSVNTGNPCADTNPDEIAGPVWASVPADQYAGNRYISHTLDYNGYSDNTIIRVLALADNTVVTSPTSSSTLTYRGEFIEFNIDSGSNSVFECDKPCRAAQYSTNSDNNPSGSAVFMSVLAPTSQYGTSVLFNKPETNTVSMTDYMSIVYLTESPDSSPLLYDGVALSGWTTATGEGYSSVEVEVDGLREVAHTLIATQSIGFSALIHGQGTSARGYGFNAGFTFGGTPNVTRPSPRYRVSMTGNFRSGDGLDFSLSCTDSYSVEMNKEASVMVIQVNELIGSTLCPTHTTEQIRAVSVTSPFITNGNEGSTELRFILAPDLNILTQGQVITCGEDIGNHLLDHSNWKNPILPQLPGCSAVVFNSAMFNDSGRDWFCVTGLEDQPLLSPPGTKQQVTLTYVVRHTGTFSTVDGSDITPGCLADYNTEFDQSTFSQVEDVQGMIASGTLCSGTGVTLETATTSLTGQEDTGISHQSYFFALGDSSLAEDVFSCADQVSDHLSPHTNWEVPIIPSVPSCPNLQFNPELFSEDTQEWLCV